MIEKFLTLALLLTSLIGSPSHSNLSLNQNKTKLTYTLTKFGIPFKRKSLRATGHISMDRNAHLHEIKLESKFNSKSSLFRRTINQKQYPSFSFYTKLQTPIPISKSKPVRIKGFVNFHGVTRQVTLNLICNSTKKHVALDGYLAIKMTDFGIKPPKIFFISVDDRIKTKIELFA